MSERDPSFLSQGKKPSVSHSLSLAACLTLAAGTSAAALAATQSGCGPAFEIASVDEQDAGLGEGGSGGDAGDGGIADVDGGKGGEGGTDAGDPCADAVLNGFTVTVKGLPSNKYDWDLFRAGASIKDSLVNGAPETTDSVITGVRYDDELLVQSKPDVLDAPEIEKYATQNEVSVPAGCIDEVAKKRGIIPYDTMSASDFQAMRDTCPTCTTISSDTASPVFHYQYKNPSSTYKSSLYHITFKKP